MGMTMIEKILALHSKHKAVKPGDIILILKSMPRVARDFGGANVVKKYQGFRSEDWKGSLIKRFLPSTVIQPARIRVMPSISISAVCSPVRDGDKGVRH